MSRLLVTTIGMFVMLAAFAIPVLGQEEICEDLQGLHTVHGDDLFEFLSDAGEDCLNEMQKLSPPASTAADEAIKWSESGRGSVAIPVTLDLSQGTYSLNLIEPSQEGDWGNIWLHEVISVPDSCFPWSTMFEGPIASFSSHLPISQECRLFATLSTDLPYGSDTSWAVSITKISDEQPITPSSLDWSVKGRGQKYVPVAISFDPGIYRINISDAALGGESNYGGTMQFQLIRDNPNGCFPGSSPHLPTQIRIRETCSIVSTLVALLHSEHADTPWEASIIKLD